MKALLGCVLVSSLVGCKGSTSAPAAEAPIPEAPAAEAPVIDEGPFAPGEGFAQPSRARPPGIEADAVECDPARPEMPCTPDLERAIEPPPIEPTAIPRLGEGRSEQAIRGCRTEADCVVACRVDGNCCPDLCQCANTYNTAFFAELKAHQAACTQKGCFRALCSDPGFNLVPSCVEGLCGVVEKPY